MDIIIYVSLFLLTLGGFQYRESKLKRLEQRLYLMVSNWTEEGYKVRVDKSFIFLNQLESNRIKYVLKFWESLESLEAEFINKSIQWGRLEAKNLRFDKIEDRLLIIEKQIDQIVKDQLHNHEKINNLIENSTTKIVTSTDKDGSSQDEVVTDLKEFTCTMCARGFKTQKGLTTHLGMHNSGHIDRSGKKVVKEGKEDKNVTR